MKRVLVVDDEPVARSIIVEMLETVYDVVAVESAEDGIRLLDEGDGVAAIVSDLVMPGRSGLDLADEVHARHPNVPIVLASGAGTTDNLSGALAHGVQGFVAKPFTTAELHGAVEAALRRAERSEEDMRERLLAPTLASVLGNAVEARQTGMSGHCERLAALARRIAIRLAMDEREVALVDLGATLHDIGKIGIPDRILLLEGPLTPADLAVMRTHPVIGDRLLEPLGLSAVREVVRHHHERWDGAGYPDRLRGEEIPLAARVVAVADAVEAMSAQRIYRAPLRPEQILAELHEGSGRQWDPRVVDVVLALIEEGELHFSRDQLELLPDDCAEAA